MRRRLKSAPLRVLLTAFAVLGVATGAHAGIADTPLPTLVVGKSTLYLYSVPGVISFGGLESVFSCTSTDTTAMQVGVELFGNGGGDAVNDAVATPLNVAPGATVTFGTQGLAGIAIDSSLGGGGRGSARILSTSKKLACTAFIADAANAPPTSMVQLTIIAKLKQKAAN